MHDVCVSFCRRCNRMVVIGLRIYRSVFFCNKLPSFYNGVDKRVGGEGGKNTASLQRRLTCRRRLDWRLLHYWPTVFFIKWTLQASTYKNSSSRCLLILDRHLFSMLSENCKRATDLRSIRKSSLFVYRKPRIANMSSSRVHFKSSTSSNIVWQHSYLANLS